MADLNDLHLLMGQAIKGIENLEEGISSINKRLEHNVQPVLDDYQSTKNKLVGVCACISAVAGGSMAWITGLFKQ